MRKTFVAFFLLLLFSCDKQPKPAVSFYYWKTVFALTQTEKTTLSHNRVTKIYLRYFDIDVKNGDAFPTSPIVFREKPQMAVVPVIYIKNAVLLQDLDLHDLAKKAADYVKQINKKHNISCNEIQIDCDWTLASKASYFEFIGLFKKASAVKLSTTIRLHQVKYFKKTGIPNVDRGVLMYYNMGKIAPDSLNSIYDRTIAQHYLESFEDYPMALDVALPVYSWSVHIRDGRVIGLRSKTEERDFGDSTYFKSVAPNRILVVRSGFHGGMFYKKGDFLKKESVTEKQLFEIGEDLADHLQSAPKEIIYYDLDDINLNQYDKDVFQKVADLF